MISQTVEYALRAVVFLADRRESPSTTQQIAAATHIPPAYLSKVMQNLGRAGLVGSRRGLRGGFTLSRPPEAMTIWDVLEAVEPLRRIRTCPLELAAHRIRLCPLHQKLDDALALIERAMRDTTLAAIISEPSPSKPLCPFPRVPLA